jgi:hypothetical protein
VLAVRLNVLPEQIGALLVIVGAAGGGLIVTVVVPAEPVHPATVAETEYVPASAVVNPATVGFCAVEVKLLGPFQR